MDNGGPAFPLTETVLATMKFQPANQGMTLRDYFAAAALGSVLMRTPSNYQPDSGISPQEEVARHAYLIADAMIEARGE